VSADELVLVTAVGAWIVASVFLLAVDWFARWSDERDAGCACDVSAHLSLS
jgi:hypothetical protein